MEINITEKKPIIRNASGISAYDKEYYKNYASQKTKQLIRCESCGVDISYFAMSRHRKTKRHLKNIEQI